MKITLAAAIVPTMSKIVAMSLTTKAVTRMVRCRDKVTMFWVNAGRFLYVNSDLSVLTDSA